MHNTKGDILYLIKKHSAPLRRLGNFAEVFLVIRNWLRNFMIGRYGPDHLNVALLILSIIIGIVSSLVKFLPLSILGDIVLIYAFFRMFSRNITARRRENDKFVRVWWPIKNKIKSKWVQLKSLRSYKFFKCPECKQTLRVPRKKGKIQITCPKCGERFIKKT